MIKLIVSSSYTYSNEVDGETQTGQKYADVLEEFRQSTVTNAINPKNNAAESELGY